MKKFALTNEERLILHKLSNEQLLFFKKLASDKDFYTLKEVVNILIDIEKNVFFGVNEAKIDPQKLHAQHAYARGGIGKLTNLLRLIVAADHELQYRENERVKNQDKN